MRCQDGRACRLHNGSTSWIFQLIEDKYECCRNCWDKLFEKVEAEVRAIYPHEDDAFFLLPKIKEIIKSRAAYMIKKSND